MSESFSFTLEQQEDYAFLIRFKEGMAELLTDEPPPLGQDAGPNPARLLAASVANCLSASLLFALRKFKNEPGKLTATVTATHGRNEDGRLRIAQINVDIRFTAAASEMVQLERIFEQFENFCVVTQSVRSGVPVSVRVLDGEGQVLHSH